MSVCPNCGNEISEASSYCPFCGEPTHKNKRKKKNFHFIYVLFIIILIAACVFVYLETQSVKYDNYYDTVNEIYNARNTSLDEVNECSKLLLAVWKDTVFGEVSPETSPYVYPGGIYVSDINETLSNLYSDPEFSQKLQVIDTQQKRLRKLRRELQEPPKDELHFNELILRMADIHIDVSVLILEPKGNYFDMLKNFNDLIEESNEIVRELDSYNF